MEEVFSHIQASFHNAFDETREKPDRLKEKPDDIPEHELRIIYAALELLLFSDVKNVFNRLLLFHLSGNSTVCVDCSCKRDNGELRIPRQLQYCLILLQVEIENEIQDPAVQTQDIEILQGNRSFKSVPLTLMHGKFCPVAAAAGLPHILQHGFFFTAQLERTVRKGGQAFQVCFL